MDNKYFEWFKCKLYEIQFQLPTCCSSSWWNFLCHFYQGNFCVTLYPDKRGVYVRLFVPRQRRNLCASFVPRQYGSLCITFLCNCICNEMDPMDKMGQLHGSEFAVVCELRDWCRRKEIHIILGLFSIYGWVRSYPMREDVTHVTSSLIG